MTRAPTGEMIGRAVRGEEPQRDDGPVPLAAAIPAYRVAASLVMPCVPSADRGPTLTAGAKKARTRRSRRWSPCPGIPEPRRPRSSPRCQQVGDDRLPGGGGRSGYNRGCAEVKHVVRARRGRRPFQRRSIPQVGDMRGDVRKHVRQPPEIGFLPLQDVKSRPSWTSRRVRCEPTKPEAPVTSARP